MSCIRIIFASGIVHGVMVFLALNHVGSLPSEVQLRENLQHFVTVRLQLPNASRTSEILGALTEETIETIETSVPTPVQPRSPEAPPKSTVDQPVAHTPKKKTPIDSIKRRIQPSNSKPSDDLQADTLPEIATAPKPASGGSSDLSPMAKPNLNRLAVTATPARGSKTQRRAAKQAYWQVLNRFFKRSGYRYPRRAELAGQEGKVYITVEIDPSGRIINALISKSSGFPILDEAALASVIAAKRLPPLPEQLNTRNRKFRIPIEYRLPT